MTSTPPKARPLTFSIPSGGMIRAIQDGTKTITSRVIKPQPKDGYEPRSEGDFTEAKFRNGLALWQPKCPYGEVGDYLWVREAYANRVDVDPIEEPEKARHYCLYAADQGDHPSSGMHWHNYGNRWKSSRNMPRWAARTWLAVTGRRVQRVHDKTAAECLAEGISPCLIPATGDHPDMVGYMAGPDDKVSNLDKTPQETFQKLWDDTYGSQDGGVYAWALNPWAWVVKFKRIKGNPFDEQPPAKSKHRRAVEQ